MISRSSSSNSRNNIKRIITSNRINSRVNIYNLTIVKERLGRIRCRLLRWQRIQRGINTMPMVTNSNRFNSRLRWETSTILLIMARKTEEGTISRRWVEINSSCNKTRLQEDMITLDSSSSSNSKRLLR